MAPLSGNKEISSITIRSAGSARKKANAAPASFIFGRPSSNANTPVNNKKIPVYGSKKTIKALLKKYTFCFKAKQGYKPIMKTNVVKNNFLIKLKNKTLKVKAFDVIHGMIKATGYLFNNVAYISDCNKIPNSSLKNLYKLDFLIIDCLKMEKHPSHFCYQEVLDLVKLIKPKKTILTNLHTDLDYESLNRRLPKNIVAAYDGINFSF